MSDKTAARILLKSLVGQPISTVTGGRTPFCAWRGESVVVATSRSPTGQPVPVEWVPSGLDQLLETGEIEVSVPSLGYRSSFVGAPAHPAGRRPYPDDPSVIRLNQSTTGER
jgi:hypothetical protein